MRTIQIFRISPPTPKMTHPVNLCIQATRTVRKFCKELHQL